MAFSAVPAAFGFLHLGRNLSPWPHPRETNRLVTHGIYRHLRHPLYLSLVGFASGWALWRQSWLAFLGSAFLLAVLRVKAEREEHLLRQRHPHYEAYARATGGFWPARPRHRRLTGAA